MAILSHIIDKEEGISSLRKRFIAWKRSDLIRLCSLGLLGFANIYGFVLALSYVTSFNSALLHPTIPVVSAVAASASGVEPLSFNKGLGVLVSALGAVIVVVFGVTDDRNTEGDHKGGQNRRLMIGNAFLLGQCVAMGLLLVLQKSLLGAIRIPPTTLTFIYNSIASVPALIVTLALVDPRSPAEYSFQYSIEVFATVYGAVFGICFIYVLLTWATSKIGPTSVSLSMMLQGPLNGALACLFLGRRGFTPGEIGGGLLIVFGLVVTVLGDPFTGHSTASPSFMIQVDNDDDGLGALGAFEDASDHDEDSSTPLEYRATAPSEKYEMCPSSPDRKHGYSNPAISNQTRRHGALI